MKAKERQEKISAVYSTLPPAERSTAILVSQIDPDAIGAAMGLQYILKAAVEVPSEIFYAGKIGHPQNRSIFNRFDLGRFMKPIKELDPEEQRKIALVDSSSMVDVRIRQYVKAMTPIVIIDHHRGCEIEEFKNNVVWIEDVGAVSTLIVELLQAIDFKITEENRNLAILLALGIYTDTKALVGGNFRDSRAYSFLTKPLSPQELTVFLDYPLPRSHFEYLKHALTDFEVNNSRLVASVGELNEGEGDILATIADYLIRMEGMTLAVVWGRIGEKIRISARNRDITMPLGEFLKSRFGEENAGAKLMPDGRGEGGALLTFDLGLLYSSGTKGIIDELVGKRIKELVFAD